MSTCRACPAEIRWARTVNEKSIPLDAEPTDQGNVRLIDGVAHVLGPLEQMSLSDDERAELYMPHHATCPNWGS